MNHDSYIQKVEKDLESFAEELSDRYEELNFIYKIGSRIGQVEDFRESLNYILQKAIELVDANFVYLHVPIRKIFDSVSSNPEKLPVKSIDVQLIKKRTSELIKIFQSGYDYILDNDLRDYPFMSAFRKAFKNLLIIPVVSNEKPVGFIFFSRGSNRKAFTISDKRLLSVISDIISIKIKNAELFQDLRQFLFGLMKSFVKTIEEKDTYTRGHSERVNKYSLKIGSELDLNEKEMEALSFASILHDIGKIGISEVVLNKPKKLIKAEMDMIKQHPLKGYNILKPIKQLNRSLPGILYHHERIDGKGYPKRLSGHEIPLQAKIISVADIYDAMTSDRAYRKSLHLKNVVQEMLRVSGTQIDADVTRIFLSQCLRVNISKMMKDQPEIIHTLKKVAP